MQLTSRSNYAMRLLMFCAAAGDRLTPVGEIARAGAMSEAHLAKIANDLARLGFLETARGRNGGVRLARPAETINLAEVIGATETGRCLVECLDPAANTCPLVSFCRFRGMLGRAQAAFMAVLAEHSLDELVTEPDMFGALLGEAARGELASAQWARADPADKTRREAERLILAD